MLKAASGYGLIFVCAVSYGQIPAQAPKLDLSPAKPLLGRSLSAFSVEAPQCVGEKSRFTVEGKGLSDRQPQCAVECSDGSEPSVRALGRKADRLVCIVTGVPDVSSCRLGARSAGDWLASGTVKVCGRNKAAPALKKPAKRLAAPTAGKKTLKPGSLSIGDQDAPSLKPIAPGSLNKPPVSLNPAGSAPPSGKQPAPGQPAPDGGATQRAAERLQHTVRLSLTMRGTGDTRMTEWEPIERTVRRSLTMRGLGDASTTVYEPINITVTTPLTMRGLHD